MTPGYLTLNQKLLFEELKNGFFLSLELNILEQTMCEMATIMLLQMREQTKDFSSEQFDQLKQLMLELERLSFEKGKNQFSRSLKAVPRIC